MQSEKPSHLLAGQRLLWAKGSRAHLLPTLLPTRTRTRARSLRRAASLPPPAAAPECGGRIFILSVRP